MSYEVWWIEVPYRVESRGGRSLTFSTLASFSRFDSILTLI